MGPIVRHAAALLLASLLALLAAPPVALGADDAAQRPALPRFERVHAVAASPRALPAAEDMSDLRTALARHATPRSLAAADLDGDGMPDLAAAFALPGGSGLVAVWRGNPDALFPWSEEARRHREGGTFTRAPFLGPPLVLFVPEAADSVSIRDVDGDGAADLLAAADGSSAYRFPGDGRGAFGAAVPVARAMSAPRSAGFTITEGGEGDRGEEETFPWRDALRLRRQGTPLPPSALTELSNVSELVAPETIATALPLRLNADAVNDLVIFEQGGSEPIALVTTPAATFTVDSTADDGDFATGDGVCDTDDGTGDGPCTLRAAIEEANVTSGGVLVEFAIPQSGPWVIHTILPESPLPPVTLGSLTLDASSQAVQVSGAALSSAADGLVLNGPTNVIRSLRIQSFAGTGIEVSSTDNVVEGCWIGRTFGTQQEVGNLRGVDVLDGGNTIGGATEAARNVVSGNTEVGIRLAGAGSSRNTVQGSFIGIDASGLNSILGSTDQYTQQKGVWIVDGRPEILDNVISSNEVGIAVTGGGVISGTQIQGNFIGTDVNGTSPLPNGTGIDVSPLTGKLEVGRPTESKRNLISGNEGCGIRVTGSSGEDPEIQIWNNRVGTDVTGTAAVPNATGIQLDGAGWFAAVGSLSNASGWGNLISGNTGHGVVVFDEAGRGTLHAFGENLIGTDATGTADLGNGAYGIWIVGPAGWAEIGDVYEQHTDNANRIAFNHLGGIGIAGTSQRTSIGPNEIFANGGMGIDLVPELGPDRNDPYDTDSGPNNRQNHPVIESLEAVASSTNITVSLHSTPFRDFKVLLYSSPQCDPSGYGEGRTYLATADVTTPGPGDVTTSVTVYPAVPDGHYVTATATDLTDPENLYVYQTSEFSMCRRLDATCPHPPDLVLPRDEYFGAHDFTACRTITTDGEVVVDWSGSLELRAGRSVALGSGFRVKGNLQVVIDPSLDVP